MNHIPIDARVSAGTMCNSSQTLKIHTLCSGSLHLSSYDPAVLQIRAGFDLIVYVEWSACGGYVPKCSALLYALSSCSAHRVGWESSESEGAGTCRVAVLKLSGGVGSRFRE